MLRRPLRRPAGRLGCPTSPPSELAHYQSPLTNRSGCALVSRPQGETDRCQWQRSSLGHALLLFWAGLVPYYSAMRPRLEGNSMLGLWHWPRRPCRLNKAAGTNFDAKRGVDLFQWLQVRDTGPLGGAIDLDTKRTLCRAPARLQGLRSRSTAVVSAREKHRFREAGRVSRRAGEGEPFAWQLGHPTYCSSPAAHEL